MKNNKKYLLLTLTSLSLIALSGCGPSEENVEEKIDDVENYTWSEDIHNWVDPETGVHYLVFDGFKKGGITPRLDRHGNLIFDNVD